MNSLEQKHLDAVRDITADVGNWGEYGGQNRESQVEAAKSCADISIEFAKGLNEFRIKNKIGLPTDQLIDKYIQTLKLPP